MKPDWAEHAVTIVILSGTIISFLVATVVLLGRNVFSQLLTAIKKLDETIGKLFSKFDDHEHRLSLLEGSHKERTEMKLSCKVEK